MKTFAVHTLGCKVNSYESEALKLLMLKRGYVYNDEHPDIVICNTCSVTATSEKKTRQAIRHFSSDNSDVTIALMGCYAAIDSDALAHLPNVKVIVGTLNRHLIPELLERYFETGYPQYISDPHPEKYEYEELEVTTFTDRTRAYVKIQDGCDNFCSYCIIPYARGILRSRKKDDVINEIGQLLEGGFHEIVLTGIHTAGYGRDLEGYDFDDLIEEILATYPKLFRLRISSIEASEISERFIDMLANDTRLAHHLHIPLQAGSDHVLKAMNRHYTVTQFIEKVEYIKSRLPDIAITTDIIVGFPGETDFDFLETYNVSKHLAFAKIHVFPYSPRQGTYAATLKDEVDGNVKKQRVHRLLELSQQLESSYAQMFEGKALDIIIEQYDHQHEAYEGHSSNYLKVFVTGDDLARNQIVRAVFHSDMRAERIVETIIR